MKIDFKKIRDVVLNNIVFISLTMVLAEFLWFVAKGINMLFGGNQKNIKSVNKTTDDEDEILGV